MLLMGDPTPPQPISMRSQLRGQMFNGSPEAPPGDRGSSPTTTAVCCCGLLITVSFMALNLSWVQPMAPVEASGSCPPHSKQSTSIKVWVQILIFEKLNKELA